MSGNILWKFILTALIIFWCVMSITPLQDRPFEEYIVAQATANESEFTDLMQQAEERVVADQAPTLFIALRDLGEEADIDYAKFFPQINVADIANQDKRNDILLKYILRTAQSQLSLGLDLKGGVGVTLMMEAAAQDEMSQVQRAEQTGVRVTDREIDRSLSDVARQNGLSLIELRRARVRVFGDFMERTLSVMSGTLFRPGEVPSEAVRP